MARIYNMDARQVGEVIPEETVQVVCTSPPYWGLRDYGVEPSIWGGDPDCDHEWQTEMVYNDKITRKASKEKWTRSDGTRRNADKLKEARWKRDTRCTKCNAWLGCLGLEPTPEQYVANIVEVFRAIWRVLRPDGTVWLNLGDSYNGSGGAGGDYYKGGLREGQPRYPGRRVKGLKPKDLCGIPWRVAFALQEDGWYLRSDIVWEKPNPMPESATDRPTRAHEYVFLLTKSPRYYYDRDAIAEPAVTKDQRKLTFKQSGGKMVDLRTPTGKEPSHRPNRKDAPATGTRNRRSVWTISPSRFTGAHFATFPKELPMLCILAGSRPGDVVLDPFAGSGTTLYVAEQYGREAVGFEVNPEYIQLIEKRLEFVSMKLNF